MVLLHINTPKRNCFYETVNLIWLNHRRYVCNLPSTDVSCKAFIHRIHTCSCILGLDTWTRYLDSMLGLDTWTRYLDSILGLDTWTQYLDSILGLDTWTRYLDSILGLDTWTRYLDSILGLDTWTLDTSPRVNKDFCRNSFSLSTHDMSKTSCLYIQPMYDTSQIVNWTCSKPSWPERERERDREAYRDEGRHGAN
jgi:hypothetical protein